MAPEVEQVFREGRLAHVAVVSARGPHVTPELYAWSDGRLWFWFAHTTLKARVLAATPQAAALVTAGGRTGIVTGTVDLIDVRRPTTLLGTPARGLRAVRALGGYATRNASDLGAFARDLGTGRLGWRPPATRVLASLQPHKWAAAEDDRVTGSDGLADMASDRPPIHPPAAGGETVVVAFPGPNVVPGRWFADDGVVWVDPSLLDSLGVGRRTPIAVVADQYVAPGPAAKIGTLLRGSAVRRGTGGSLQVEADTLTWWDGIATETSRSGASER